MKLKEFTKGYSVDEWLVIIGAASVFLPSYITYASMFLLSATVLIRRESRQRIFSDPVYRYFWLVLPIFIFPTIVSKNLIGVSQGLCFGFALFFVCHMFSVMTVKLYDKIIDVMLCLSVLSAVYAFIEFYCFGSRRTSATFFHPNIYASAIEVFIFAAFYRYSKTKNKVYFLSVLINLFGLVLSNCRTAWLALAVAAVFYVIHYVKKFFAFLTIGVLVVGAFALIFIYMPRMDSNDLFRSTDIRVAIWQVAWEWINKNPIMGYGSMFFMSLDDNLSLGFTPHAHNIILNTMLDYGLVGLSYFSVLFGKYYSVLIRNSVYSLDYDKISKLIVTLTVCFLVHGVTDAILIVMPPLFILTLVMTSGAFAERNERWNKKLPSRHCK